MVWTIDRTNRVMKGYKDGQYVDEVDITALGNAAISDDKLFSLGKAGEAASMYTGLMDNVGIYDFVLHADDTKALCEAINGVGNCP